MYAIFIANPEEAARQQDADRVCGLLNLVFTQNPQSKIANNVCLLELATQAHLLAELQSASALSALQYQILYLDEMPKVFDYRQATAPRSSLFD